MKTSLNIDTKPEDRISFFQKVVYGLGSLCNNLLAAALGCMSIVLNLGLGMDPAWIGTIMSASRFTDALVDPVMGYVSDHTRSKWGRRRPYIFVGAILSGLIFALMWQMPEGHSQNFYFWFFMIGTTIFYLAYTIFAAPFIALGYEVTPDYHERTRLMGVSNFLGQFAWVAVPWFYAIMENKTLFKNSVQGAKGLAIAVGVVVIVAGILPAIFFKERYGAIAESEEKKGTPLRGLGQNVLEFLKSFLVTLRMRPFLKLCLATFMVFNGYMVVSGFSSYIIIYYIFGGDKSAGATYMGWFGTVSSICTFAVIVLITWLSTKIGKRRAFFTTISISIVGYALKWFCYKPGHPLFLLLPAPLISFGLGGLFTLMGSMMADVCDLDELENGRRREGMFGAIYWWVVKLGMALALAISGHLLNITGFDVKLESAQSAHTLYLLRVFDVWVPILTSAIALWAVATYPISESRAREIRADLEKRRGEVLPESEAKDAIDLSKDGDPNPA